MTTVPATVLPSLRAKFASLPAIALVLLLAVPAPASAQAGESRPAPEATGMALPRDTLVTEVATLANPGQRYAIYLPPSDPQPSGTPPLLIILDARGRAESSLRMALDAARRNGWIVMSAYGSRSDTQEAVTLGALQALLDEAPRRFAYDRRRVYLAGLSGTAKTLWTQVDALRGVLAGLIGCGGGRPREVAAMRPPPAFYGLAGTRDFNFREMQALDAELERAGAVHRLAVFDGGHGWPPDPAAFGAAIDWLELMAMRQGRIPRREAWIDLQLAEARQAAAASADPLARWRAADGIARDFAGLRGVSAERGTAAALAGSAELRAARASDDRLRASERRQGRRFDDWRARAFGRDGAGRMPDPPGVARSLAELRIRALQRQAADRRDPSAADAASRVLERDFVATAFYLPSALLASGEPGHAAASLAIAEAIFPDRPAPHWRRARALAMLGRRDDAFAELRASRALGFLDGEDLRGDDVWRSLRDDPRWRALLEDPAPP